MESNWFGPRDRTTIEPVMRLLELYWIPSVRYKRFTAMTREELKFHLNKWRMAQFNNHPILFLGFHGQPGTIWLSEQQELSLEELGEILEGRCRHRVIHFGSCSTLTVENQALIDFRQQTETLAVFG